MKLDSIAEMNARIQTMKEKHDENFEDPAEALHAMKNSAAWIMDQPKHLISRQIAFREGYKAGWMQGSQWGRWAQEHEEYIRKMREREGIK